MIGTLLLAAALTLTSATNKAQTLYGAAAHVWRAEIEHRYLVGSRDRTYTTFEYCIGFQPLMGLPQKETCSVKSWEDAFEKHETKIRLAKLNAAPVASTPIEFVPSIWSSRSAFEVGQVTSARWNSIQSPTPTDWIGLYRVGADDGDFITWLYTNCETEPSDARPAGLCGFFVHEAGRYEFRLFTENGFTRIATSQTFVVGVQ